MYVINEKYRNSRKVDYNRWSDAAEVNRLVDDLIAGMKAELGIKKYDGYRFNMKTLLMELYHSHLTDREQFLAFHRATDHYHFKVKLSDKGKKVAVKKITVSRYIKNPHITHTYFVGCIDFITTKGYIETSDGGSFRDGEGGSYGYLSRMRATETLAALWGEYGFTAEMIKRFQPEETIILKGPVQRIPYLYKGKKRIRKYKPDIPDYKDTLDVQDKRKAIEAYNLLLDRTHIDIDAECITNADREELLDRLLHARDKFRYSINLGSKQVYRVFNNGSFKDGGRFYGAFWVGCPSILRKYITINGESTVELDYSGIHINILYAFKKINFAELNSDAYELVENDPDRKLNKLILLTAYNADSPEATAKAVFNSARLDGTLHRYQLKKHTQIYDKLELLKQKHAPIAEYIANKYGSKLQYHDSCVLERLIKHFTKLKIPILTVHDSIICQAKHKDFVKDKMLQLYTAYINEAFECANEYNPAYLHAGTAFQKLRDTTIIEPRKLIAAINKLTARTTSYKGKIPIPQNKVIEVSEDSTQHKCSRICNHNKRLSAIKAGKRVFLGKIRIQTKVNEGVVAVEIVQ